MATEHASKAEIELVADVAAGFNATTEARAGVKAGKVGLPASNSQVQAALTRELQAAYRQMPKDMQQQLKATVEAAGKIAPDAWISKVKLSK